MPESVWIMCCGKLGRCIAQYYNRENVPEVIGWVRTNAALEAGLANGVRLRQGKLDSSCTQPFYTRENVWVFWFAPPPARGVSDIRLRRFLLSAGTAIDRLLLLSHHRDEPAHTPREQRYADAEQAAKAWAQQSGRELVIVRQPPHGDADTPEQLAALCQQAMHQATDGSILIVNKNTALYQL